MRAVCLNHMPSEGPGAFANSLANIGVALDYPLVPKDGLPSNPGDLLIVMDGSISNLVSKKKRQPESVQSLKFGTKNRCSRRNAASATCF